MTVDADVELVCDLRARWLELERRAEAIGDDDLTSWVETTACAMLMVRDRLERLHADELITDLERRLAEPDVDEAAA